ncbi:DUF736 family protein [Bradyrhizobium sp. 200]|uniref:DUF736 family protein n=1 Tax=Bradyrhizobium sp. 200 TaxID=2782665 RepID=UPI001FFECD10|nr:DUF736 family protein [Bradyrhizobium sp. 200]
MSRRTAATTEGTSPLHLCRPVRDGAACCKLRTEGRHDYFSLELDDLSFNAPICANLIEEQVARTIRRA